MCRENPRKGGTPNAQDYGSRLSVVFCGVFVSTELVQLHIYVEGNINWDKYIDILDNTLTSRCKIENNLVGILKMSTPNTDKIVENCIDLLSQ